MKKMNVNFEKVVSILNDCEFHDGTSLGKQLKITRTAIWKIVKKLTGYHIPIQSIKKKGYALSEPLLLLDKQKIKQQLDNRSIIIDLFEQIGSTNDYLQTFCSNNEPRICLAEMQTEGKGRFHREWYSPFGKNIYLSLLYPFNKDISELAGLSLVVGLAVCKAIEEAYYLPEPVLVKWPNDIICSDKKLAGTLIELKAETHGFSHAVIGIGLNVNMDRDKQRKIHQAWTSIKILNEKNNDRNILCIKLINQLFSYIKKFSERGLASFIEEWNSRDYLLHKTICLKSNTQEFRGEAIGVNGQGHLLLKLKDGSQRSFSQGDTTLAK